MWGLFEQKLGLKDQEQNEKEIKPFSEELMDFPSGHCYLVRTETVGHTGESAPQHWVYLLSGNLPITPRHTELT